MSRLCRLRTKTHGEDGQWAYEEITKLREQVAVQAAVIERERAAMKSAENSLEWVKTHAATASAEVLEGYARGAAMEVRDALAIPTDSTQILAEVRRAERERCIYVINAQKNPITTNYANGLVFDPANNMVDKCAAAIRAMG